MFKKVIIPNGIVWWYLFAVQDIKLHIQFDFFPINMVHLPPDMTWLSETDSTSHIDPQHTQEHVGGGGFNGVAMVLLSPDFQ